MNFDLKKITRENVKALKPYASARDEYVATGANMVFLDANENPYDNGVNRYPDPHQRSLKTAISRLKRVSESQILLGNGSDEVLDLLFRAFCEPNVDNIISLPPTYGMYKVLSGTNAIENREVLLTKDFQPNETAIQSVVDENSKVLFLCSPNNPTGNILSETIIERLVKNFSGLVVIDEAYIDFANTNSWINRLDEFPNLVVTQTLSKAYGMAAIRLGLCFASKEIISILKKIKPPYNVNELTQQRALEGILDQDKVKTEVSELIQQREEMIVALKSISFVDTVYASEANFVLVKVDDANLRYQQLLDKGIVIRNRSSQPLCANTLRFTVGKAKENKTLLKALNEIE